MKVMKIIGLVLVVVLLAVVVTRDVDDSTAQAAKGGGPPKQCNDGIDNDGDGLVDWPADPGCRNNKDNDEYNAGNLPLVWTLETCYLCTHWPISLDANGMPFFIFGDYGDSGSASKLTETWSGATSGGFHVRATIGMDPSTVWYNDDTDALCTNTPHFRPYFQTADWASSGDPDDRWWATSGSPTVPLVAGTYDFTIPFDPPLWSNVNGKRADESPERTAAFFASLAEGGRSGGTFGCGSFFGHGVYTQGGSADMHLEVFDLIP